MSADTELDEIDRRIAIVRDNLRNLTEQAAGYSGARDEDLVATRISDEEAELADLMKRRTALAPAAPPKEPNARGTADAGKPGPAAKKKPRQGIA